jgi:endo-1,4-beta-xylanase
VRERDFDLPDAERDHLVADQTRRYLDLALAEASVRGVVTWGLSDKHSWLTENPTQAQLSASGHRLVNRDLPYDQACRRTQMYEAIRGAFDDSARIGTAFGGGGNPVVGAMNPAKV